jgi:hypothetical protein
MPINKQWHLKHRMPKSASIKQRVKWHTGHAKNCDCRDSKGYLQKLKAAAKL